MAHSSALITEAAVTLLAVVYTCGYRRPNSQTPSFYALLMLFAIGMSGTTLADDMFLFYILWELMLVASCVLIAVWGEGDRRGARALGQYSASFLARLPQSTRLNPSVCS